MKASAGSAATTRATSAAPPRAAPKATAPRAAAPKAAAKLTQKADMNQDNTPAEALVDDQAPAVAKPTPAPAAQEPAASRPGFAAPAVAAVTAPASAPMMNDRRPPDRGPAPRAHAKQETFVEGDYVVYPTHGVGKVERIATEEIAGHKLELIHITFEENRMTLRVPVPKAPAAGLRKLATRKMFDEALAVLKGRARIKRTMWSRRAQEYEAKINSGDPLAIAEVVRDLHRNAGQPDQSFSERQIYEAAMDRLAAELAALDKTDKATASEKLTSFLKTIA
jgi:CarD family transcriptional regulator